MSDRFVNILLKMNMQTTPQLNNRYGINLKKNIPWKKHGKISLYHTVIQRTITSSLKYSTLQQEQMNMSIDGQTKDILKHHYATTAKNLKT